MSRDLVYQINNLQLRKDHTREDGYEIEIHNRTKSSFLFNADIVTPDDLRKLADELEKVST